MTAHVFLRYVAPECELTVRSLGFRKFTTENGVPIWMLDEFLSEGNPLHGLDTDVVVAYLRELSLCGQIFEAVMWGPEPD